MKRHRITIGFFVSNLDYEYQSEIWRGICDEAVKLDVNVICFPGAIIQSRYGFEYQGNILYKIAGKENLDGIIILSSTIGQAITEKELIDFFHSYDPLPVVSIGIKLENIPNIIVDNESGLYELITHLVKKHSCKRFAFLSGPAKHQEAEQRLQTFKKVMKENESVIEKVVYLNGEFRQDAGSRAICELLDKIKEPVDAVVAASDSMAIGALEVFQARGIKVPGEVIVTGYDNIRESQNYTPPLSTVNQPVYKMGRTSLQFIKKIINHEDTPPNIVLPSKMVLRQSCGCFSHKFKQLLVENISSKGVSFFSGFLHEKDTIVAECLESIEENSDQLFNRELGKKQVENLVEAFYLDIKDNESHYLITLLNTILQDYVIKDIDVTFWSGIFRFIRNYAIGFELTREELAAVENRCEQARMLIGDTLHRYQAFKRIQLSKWTDRLREIGNSLISTFDIDKLINAILSAILDLQIPQCYLSLYQIGENFPEKAQLFLAYNNGERISIEEEHRIYPIKELLPPGIFHKEKRMMMIVEPLYFQNDQIGFLFCEIIPDKPIIFEILRRQISSALKGALLLEEIKQYADNLEKEVARRTLALTKSNKQLEEEICLRKKVEESLKEGEENLRAITEATPIPLVIARMTDGSILYANMPFCMSLGIKGENEWHYKLQDFFYDKKYIQEILDRLKTEDHLTNIELSAHKKGGDSFWVISSFQKMVFKGEECILSGFYDLTERRKLEREVLEAIGNERRRIGQDLHDDICQDMAGMAAIACIIEKQLIKLDPDNVEKSSYLRKLIRNTIVKTKALAKGLYPTGLENNGLDVMFEELSNSIQIQFNIPCTINCASSIEINDNLLTLQLYRIAQEAALNAVRHGNPNHIEINFSSTPEKMELIIKDDGVGISLNSLVSGGMGIQSMKYRANMIDGKLEIKRNGKNGTIVTCTIPSKNYKM
ncbi:MAG: substrate-binding domain-containing protein [Spirochaetales bacterium]|nr:substrate-binding domain-containing protein [Spirochaetales bacterium]